MILLSFADFYSKFTFKKKYFKNTIRVSNSLDPDQDRHNVGPDLGPTCLQRLSEMTKVTLSKERAKVPHIICSRGQNLSILKLKRAKSQN